MKIAVSSYSFRNAILDGRMTLLDVLPKAKEMGFEGVEIANVGPSSDPIREIAKDLFQQSKDLELPIVAYLTGADLLKDDQDAEIDRLRREVELAALLGAPKMRHDAIANWDPLSPLPPFSETVGRLAEGYRRVTEFAAGLGVKTMIENHGYYAQDSDRVKMLIDKVDHPNFGWLADMGNFLCVDEPSLSAIRVAAPYAIHAHAKDFHTKPASWCPPRSGWFTTRGGNHLRGAMIGHGDVDVKGCLEILKSAGYDGWVSVEFEGMEDPLFAIEESLYNLKSYLR